MTDSTEKARLLLQVRRLGVTDTAVLAAVESVPRELFVPESFADYAYDDRALPIDCEQTISQPSLVAMMTSALAVGDRMKVLEVGTGSGYQAAILSKLCRRVYTIERHRTLMSQAEARFERLKLRNITTRVGDGRLGWPEQAPFERIIVTAAADPVPQALLDQLAIDGRMVIPVGPAGEMQMLRCITRDVEGYHEEDLLPVRFVPLVGGQEPANESA